MLERVQVAILRRRNKIAEKKIQLKIGDLVHVRHYEGHITGVARITEVEPESYYIGLLGKAVGCVVRFGNTKELKRAWVYPADLIVRQDDISKKAN